MTPSTLINHMSSNCIRITGGTVQLDDTAKHSISWTGGQGLFIQQQKYIKWDYYTGYILKPLKSLKENYTYLAYNPQCRLFEFQKEHLPLISFRDYLFFAAIAFKDNEIDTIYSLQALWHKCQINKGAL